MKPKRIVALALAASVASGCAAAANKYIDARARCTAGDQAACIEQTGLIAKCIGAQQSAAVSNAVAAGGFYWRQSDRVGAELGSALGGAIAVGIACAGQDTVPGTPGAEVAAPVPKVPYAQAQP